MGLGSCTYSASTNTITVTGYISGSTPWAFNDLWNADKAGSLQLLAPTAAALDLSLTQQVRPTDKVALKLNLVITNFSVAGTVTLTGKDKDGNAQTEVIDVAGNGTRISSNWYSSIDASGVDCVGTFTVEITQSQWGCFDDKTEILSENGWKLFKDLKSDEKVITLNSATDEMEYQKPTRHFRYKVTTKLFLQDSPSINLCVTDNHGLWIRKVHARTQKGFDFIQADQSPRHVEYKRDGVWKGKEQKYFVLPSVKLHDCGKLHDSGDRKISMDDWLRFLGVYLSEGSCCKSPSGYTIRVFHKDPDKTKEMFNYLKKIGDALIWNDQNGKAMSLSDKQLYITSHNLEKPKTSLFHQKSKRSPKDNCKSSSMH